MAITAEEYRLFGAAVRAARAARRWNQAQLGAKCGYSASAVSRIEAGLMHPTLESLDRIATVLTLDLVALGLHTLARLLTAHRARRAPSGAMVAGRVMDEEDDVMRRRTLFTGVAAVSAALALPRPAQAQAHELAPYDPAGDLERLLFTPPAAVALPLTEIQGELAAARTRFTTARYQELGTGLPALISAAEALRITSAGRTRDVAHAVTARGYVLATELAAKSHNDLAWATADRALQAAHLSGDPAVVGEAVRVLAITMRRAGRPAAAVDLLRHTAGDLDAQPDPAGRAVAATLLMTAAYTAACSHDATSAHDLMTGAAEAVDRLPVGLPPQSLFTVDATRAQVDLYQVGVHTALGTPDLGVPYAARIDPAALPTAERRARLGTDTARMWRALGEGPRTLAALRYVESIAPEEARRPALRTMAAELVYAPMPPAGAREFARRIGLAS
ncbi:helix-turn-helix domain-containing protein [Kitasatospora purpeofusca]|uniref:helix-turn-helix domain-containing protein n=1 Tax=Kitasatospora purpeofusca TaxID=67352 RepID=UPI0035DBCA38